MTSITCVNCERKYQLVKIGVYLVKMFNDPPRPYQIWSADKHRCPNCGDEVLTGLGNGPIAEHVQEGFDSYLSELKANKNCTLIREYES